MSHGGISGGTEQLTYVIRLRYAAKNLLAREKGCEGCRNRYSGKWLDKRNVMVSEDATTVVQAEQLRNTLPCSAPPLHLTALSASRQVFAELRHFAGPCLSRSHRSAA